MSDSHARPQFQHGSPRVHAMENHHEQNMSIATSIRPIPNTKTQSLSEICAQIHERVSSFLAETPKSDRQRQTQEQTRVALRVIQQALEQFRLEELSLSYNGGKDCLVLLILYLCQLHEFFEKQPNGTPSISANHTNQSQRLPSKLHSVYIVSDHPFREVDEFVEESMQTYHLDLARYAKSMKEAFTDYLAEHDSIKAIFVGTRRTDPHGAHLKHFDMTDGGWPRFMRIHPVIDWHYAEIWTFIRHLEIPYCQLYDRGYTSLGGTTDTHPNPALKEEQKENRRDGSAARQYRPAYELVADDAERLGRDR